jgi:hypothetical protein
MRTIFVFLLLISLPLSGCLGESDTSEEQADSSSTEESTNSTTIINNNYNNTTVYQNTNNSPPIINIGGSGVLTNVEGIDCTTNAFETEMRHAMTDWDGMIVNAGWDINLDGVIDFPVNSSEGYTMIQIPMENMLNKTVEAGTGSNAYEYREQSVVFGAQDDAGEWTSSDLLKLTKMVSNTSPTYGTTLYIDIEPCSNVTSYAFNVEDHSDNVTSGDNDSLVIISRTNGNAGIYWDRIKIVVEYPILPGTLLFGEYICTFNSSGCRILGNNGSNVTESPYLWMPEETITIKEEGADICSTGWDESRVNIYVDDILQASWYENCN